MRKQSLLAVASLLAIPFAFACSKTPPPTTTTSGASDKVISNTGVTSNGVGSAVATDGAKAVVGEAAPDFALTDLDGKTVKLSDFKGKIVVLEWFNPECPFVKAAHTKGSLKDDAQRETARGVVWLAINSGGAGKQGFGVEKNVDGKKRFALSHPILLDPNGEVGHKYGATNTPNMAVIDSKGTLVYRGAIDNSPDGEGESPEPTGSALVNYVDAAIDAVLAGKPVAVKETRAYGCGVKYANPS